MVLGAWALLTAWFSALTLTPPWSTARSVMYGASLGVVPAVLVVPYFLLRRLIGSGRAALLVAGDVILFVTIAYGSLALALRDLKW